MFLLGKHEQGKTSPNHVGAIFTGPIVCNYQDLNWLLHIQRSTLSCTPGLVKFVPAVARLFCLVLPGSFFNMLCAE